MPATEASPTSGRALPTSIVGPSADIRLAWAIRHCICRHVGGYALPCWQFAGGFQDGIGNRTDVRVDPSKITQDVEMQRASLYTFRTTFAKPLEMPFARGKLDRP